MKPEDQDFVREFFQSLTFEPIEPTDERYVSLWEDPRLIESDPVELLARGVEWSPGGSVQLFSGFRGSGKSTELRRLRNRLRDAGFLVVLIDIEDHINLTTPIDISDFLMALSSALGEALAAEGLLDDNAAQEGFWEGIRTLIQKTKIQPEELGLELEVGPFTGSLKAAIKEDPVFKERLQKRLAGHISSLVAQVRAFFQDCTRRLVKKHGPGKQLVVLVDSLERIRGTSVNEQEVHSSVETLFAGHADKLRFPAVHLVYAVPPYLKVLHPNLAALYGIGDVIVLPAVKVHQESGAASPVGLEALERVVAKRGDWQRLLGDRQVLERLIALSGGHFRDLFRLLLEILRRASTLPVPATTVEAAVTAIRNNFLPLADQDAVWLKRVADTHQTGLVERQHLAELARFLETHLILCYRNGSEWYDVHPLVLEQVRTQAATAAQASASRE